MRLENKKSRVISLGRFILRMALFMFAALVLLALTLVAGVAGYQRYAGFSFEDAVLNASMILAGMGPVNELTSSGAKWFASAYAIFCGVVMVSVVGIVLAPIFHRVLHLFHVDEADAPKTVAPARKPPPRDQAEGGRP